MTNVAFASIKGTHLGDDKIEDIIAFPTVTLYKDG
jgi:hypothetical protein